jgi:thioredoxin reductase (NADPH)
VTIVHRRESLRASKIMAERAFSNPTISFAWNSKVTAIHGDERVTGITLSDTHTGRERELPVTGLFVAIGHDPRNELVSDLVDLDPAGYVVTGVDGTHRSTATRIPGVFACGDLVDHTYRQAVTAAGSGCAAALDAEHYLASLEDLEHAVAAAAQDEAMDEPSSDLDPSLSPATASL